MFKDQYRAVMQYSLPRDAGKSGDTGSPRLIHHDWICAKVVFSKFSIAQWFLKLVPVVLHSLRIKTFVCFLQCGVQNFRRRDYCFKCNGPKTDMEGEGYDEVSSHPTNSKYASLEFRNQPYNMAKNTSIVRYTHVYAR